MESEITKPPTIADLIDLDVEAAATRTLGRFAHALGRALTSEEIDRIADGYAELVGRLRARGGLPSYSLPGALSYRAIGRDMRYVLELESGSTVDVDDLVLALGPEGALEIPDGTKVRITLARVPS